MPLTTLLLQQQGQSEGVIGITADGFFEGSVPFDNMLREIHSFTDRVTDHPVEDGINISDHVVLGPRELTMEGLITDAPLQLIQGVDSSIEGGSSRSTRAWHVLKSYRGRILTAITGLDRIEQAMLTGVSAPRTGTTGDGIVLAIRVREVVIVTSEIVAFPNSATDRGTSQQDRGKQSANAPDEAVEQQSSFLIQGLKGLGAVQ